MRRDAEYRRFMRFVMARLFALAVPAAFVASRHKWRTLAQFLVVLAALLAGYFSIPPSLDRQWAAEVAVHPSAETDGNLVHIRNIRNFEYRTVNDFSPRYDDRTFDLDTLESVDLVSVTWGIPTIAQIIARFGFGDGQFVAFSIEMRNEVNEPHSMLRSFFRNYELIYIVADERDVLRTRAVYREPQEQIRIYRTHLPIDFQRRLFISYIDKVNELALTPEWYNTLVDNCTTGILHRTHAYTGRARYNWKMLLSGHAAEYAYELGMRDSSLSFAELRERALVSDAVIAAGTAENSSVRIREGTPKPVPFTREESQSSQ